MTTSTHQTLWLVGAGPMAQEYAKILEAQSVSFQVIGRGMESASEFTSKTGLEVITGGVENNLSKYGAPEQAIVCSGVDQLGSITMQLLKSGVKKVMVEKPGGLNSSELTSVNLLATELNADVLIAYNRRFMASVIKALDLIATDGGVTSCQFEFTEWAHKIAGLEKGEGVKEAWLVANSSHVIDLFIYFCGVPTDWQSWHDGYLHWHPASSRFCGAGLTEKGVLFSYLADWEAPGRWGAEFLTPKGRYIFRPLESLHFQKKGSIEIEKIELDDSLDTLFKPGIYLQTKAFLENDYRALCPIDQQLKHCTFFEKMAGYY